MKRIVVGTDLSARSAAAVRMAADLAEATGGSVHLVSACKGMGLAGAAEMAVPVPDMRETVSSIETELNAVADDLRRRNITVHVHAGVGEAADLLCRTAETVDADVIVVGNRRMKGASRVLGSIPNRVAHRANCSVLIARTGD